MWKKLMLSIIGIIIFISASILVTIKIVEARQEKNIDKVLFENSLNSMDLGEEYVTDECINEWKDYAESIQEEIMNTNSSLIEENTKYIIKNENDYITIYKVEKSGEEILYKRTNIYSKFLSKEDIKLLDDGIEIMGEEELNKIIEDFE